MNFFRNIIVVCYVFIVWESDPAYLNFIYVSDSEGGVAIFYKGIGVALIRAALVNAGGFFAF